MEGVVHDENHYDHIHRCPKKNNPLSELQITDGENKYLVIWTRFKRNTRNFSSTDCAASPLWSLWLPAWTQGNGAGRRHGCFKTLTTRGQAGGQKVRGKRAANKKEPHDPSQFLVPHHEMRPSLHAVVIMIRTSKNSLSGQTRRATNQVTRDFVWNTLFKVERVLRY